MDGSVVLNFPDTLFVIFLGLITVFVGLICIILICMLMSLLTKKRSSDKIEAAESSINSVVSPNVNDNHIPNKQQFIAAVSAAIAEDLGKDVSAIRILSVKKI